MSLRLPIWTVTGIRRSPRICWTTAGSIFAFPWTVASCRGNSKRGSERVELSLPSPLASNDLFLLTGAAVAGCGVAWVTEGTIDAELADGRLIQVLAGWTVTSPGRFIYHPKGRVVPPKLKRFIDELMDAASGQTR
jgi:DNA-binding transcriptional LysR family regulator